MLAAHLPLQIWRRISLRRGNSRLIRSPVLPARGNHLPAESWVAPPLALCRMSGSPWERRAAKAATATSSRPFAMSSPAWSPYPKPCALPGWRHPSWCGPTYLASNAAARGLFVRARQSPPQIVAIDYTKSNQWTGRRTFGGRCLHHLDPHGVDRNPYEHVISIVAKVRARRTPVPIFSSCHRRACRLPFPSQVLAPFDEDGLIPVFGFGDTTTTDKSVFPYFADRPCRGMDEVISRYRELTPRVVLSGPTNYAPAIEAAVQVVQKTKAYHILLIVADGQVTNKAHTEAAIIRASSYPLSIVLVGVGDGPWDAMSEFDDGLDARAFDNFQFVELDAVVRECKDPAMVDTSFAVKALMEVPEQFLAIRKLGFL